VATLINLKASSTSLSSTNCESLILAKDSEILIADSNCRVVLFKIKIILYHVITFLFFPNYLAAIYPSFNFRQA